MSSPSPPAPARPNSIEEERFPDSALRFPRAQWTEAMIGWPVFRPGHWMLIAAWAGKQASLRWDVAFKAGDMGDLDVVDFTVAVFDKADELNACIRAWSIWHNRHRSKTEAWIRCTDAVITLAQSMALKKISAKFPGHPRLQTFTREATSEFVRTAMNLMYLEGLDSFGPRPPIPDIDFAYYTDRYIPDPASLPPRPFTKADPYGVCPDAPLVIWLDSNGKQVEPPSAASSSDEDVNPKASDDPTIVGSPATQSYMSSSDEASETDSSASPTASVKDRGNADSSCGVGPHAVMLAMSPSRRPRGTGPASPSR